MRRVFCCLYNGIFGLYFFVLFPKFLIDRIKGKRHPAFLQRMGFFLPSLKSKEVIWIHAVSVGEIKAASPFYRILKEKFPKYAFCITTTTATGFEEAKRSLPNAEAYLYAPLDFSFVAKRFVKKIHPKLYFLVESDFWPQALSALKSHGAKLFLINGKFSPKAASRWVYFPKIARWMFSHFDFLCVQTEEYKNRFLKFLKDPSKICISGNLKFDLSPQAPKDLPHLKEKSWVTISCTHAGEEEALLPILENPSFSIFLAPRHPERSDVVAKFLENKNISYVKWSNLSDYTHQKVILVDGIGHLATCYALSLLAIIGGSFVKHVGGHNVLEPCLYGIPSLFGPYTFAQKQLVEKVLEGKAGLQKPIEEVFQGMNEILKNHDVFSQNSEKLVAHLRGSSQATWEAIATVLKKN